MTTPTTNKRKEIRRRGFKKVADFLQIESELLDFQDPISFVAGKNGEKDKNGWIEIQHAFGIDKLPELYKKLCHLVSEKNWDRIISHNKQGEYGHHHHYALHMIVEQILKEKDQLDKFYVLNPSIDITHKFSKMKDRLGEFYGEEKVAFDGLEHWTEGIVKASEFSLPNTQALSSGFGNGDKPDSIRTHRNEYVDILPLQKLSCDPIHGSET